MQVSVTRITQASNVSISQFTLKYVRERNETTTSRVYAEYSVSALAYNRLSNKHRRVYRKPSSSQLSMQQLATD